MSEGDEGKINPEEKVIAAASGVPAAGLEIVWNGGERRHRLMPPTLKNSYAFREKAAALMEQFTGIGEDTKGLVSRMLTESFDKSIELILLYDTKFPMDAFQEEATVEEAADAVGEFLAAIILPFLSRIAQGLRPMQTP